MYVRTVGRYLVSPCSVDVSGSSIRSPHVICTLSFHTSTPAPNKQDFYKILGVPRESTQKEIKKAYYQVRRTTSEQVFVIR